MGKNKLIHRSIDYHRTETSFGSGPREKAFADAWERHNRPDGSINAGYGVLQNLFWEPGKFIGLGGSPRRFLSQDDATVAATAIQWLATNVGFCFLQEMLKDAGYVVSSKEQIEQMEKQLRDSRFLEERLREAGRKLREVLKDV